MPPTVEEHEEGSLYDQQPTTKGHTRRSAVMEVAQKNKWYIIGGSAALLIILSVVIGVSVSTAKNSGSSASGSSSSPLSADEQKVADLMGRLESTFDVLGLPESHSKQLKSSESPQARALSWVAASEKYDSYSDDQKLQRYALASFFYGTYAVRNAYVTQQVPWTTADKWLTDEDECKWEGITCSDNGRVTKMDLEEHRVSGTIPLDIVLMREHLKEIALTNNLIFMEGDALDVFKYLENIETILLADNYIVERNGLPKSMRDLTELRKLVLSYNLLQGSIPPNYFTNLNKLTHLEVESNYLTGALPESIFDMEQLVYLYARRNDLNFQFQHAIKTANWPNMCTFPCILLCFAFVFLSMVLIPHDSCSHFISPPFPHTNNTVSLWLDHNNITGTFPTEIGNLAEMASFSLTNTTVSGPIPTEMGLLTGLRRLWLYGNKLEGEIPAELGQLPILEVVEMYGNNLEGAMPQGVCDAIASADYEYKILSADCAEVTCQDCCTQCF